MRDEPLRDVDGQTAFERSPRCPMSGPQFLSKGMKSFRDATGPPGLSPEGAEMPWANDPGNAMLGMRQVGLDSNGAVPLC